MQMHWTTIMTLAGLAICAATPERCAATHLERRPSARYASAPQRTVLSVGWQDEMNDVATWKPREGGMPAQAFSARSGAITLRLAHVPEGFPYHYQWGGVTRSATVDLGRYPILVARISTVRPGSYCHLDAEQLDYGGKPIKTLRTPTLEYAGLSFLDLGKQYGPHIRRLVLRINVGGKLEGAECEVSWVRFIRREDLPLLQEQPDRQAVKLAP
jgi:hypothetical protein